MNLPGPCFVVHMLRKKRRGMRHRLHKKIYAYGKIGRPNKSGSAFRDSFADGGKVTEPPSRAAHGINAHRSQATNIFRSGVGRSKFYGHIHSAKILTRKSLPARIAPPIEFRSHVEAVFRSKLLDQPPHLSVTNNGEAHAHAPLRPVARSCVAMRA